MNKEHNCVWVVIHCEYMQRGRRPSQTVAPLVDEMVFHVASSLRAAEKYIADRGVAPYSWWKIERRVIDEADFDADDRPQRHEYNYKGKPLTKRHAEAALRAFFAWQAEDI
jgi:hypothetical protein